MKKIVNRIYYVVMVALLLLIITILLSGCQKGPENDADTPEFVYVPEFISVSVPEGVDWISNVTVAGEKVFFSAMTAGDEDLPIELTKLYAMDFNDSNAKALPNYDMGVDFPAEAEGGHMQTYSLFIDNTGNLWLAERGEFYYYDLPDDFDGEEWDKWGYRVIIEEFTRVRKLDDTGAELLSFDISQISVGQDWFYIYAFAVDDENNVYIADESAIHVFDSNGSIMFSIDVNYTESLIKQQDGTVAYSGWGERGKVLAKVDVAGRKLGESITLPDNAHNVYPGNDEFSFLFSDGTSLYGIEAESGDDVLLLNWIESDISTDGLGNISVLPDGRIMVTSQQWNDEGTRHEIISLSKTPYSELPEREVLTLAAFYLDWNIRNTIVEFNRTSDTYRIQVTDYSEFNTEDDRNAGLTRLSTEIISGNIPDLLDVSSLPFSQYVSKDMLVDLYPLIDADPDFDRSDFLESVLRATEVNGGLYRLFPHFSIGTMIGNPAVLGSYPGWNMDEFIATLKANPKADFPMGQGLTKVAFLQALFMFNMEDYVDWSSGTVSFDSSEFVALLEFANTLPEEIDWNSDYIQENELIAEGRQIMVATTMQNFDDYQMYRALFGGDIVFKGLPAEGRNGYSLSTQTSFAITSSCTDVDGAWSFIRTFLSEDWLDEYSWRGLPINKHSFDKMMQKEMTADEYGTRSIGWNGFSIDLEPLTQADVDKVMAVIDSISGSVGQDEALWNIISESAITFFNGQSSAQDAAKVIQNRASIYISEQR